MSHYTMVIWLIVPIILVVAILLYAARRRKKLLQDKLGSYLSKVTAETGIIDSFQKHLVHQLIVVDEEERKLLVIDHKNEFKHHVFPIDAISNMNVYYHNEVLPSVGNQKSENITKQVGVRFNLETMKDDHHLVLFDHTEHSIYLKEDFEKEASQLRDKLLQFQNNKRNRRAS